MWAKMWASGQKCGQSYGQVSTANNFAKLFVSQLIVVAYRATLLYLDFLS